ncbi:MAG: pyruvate, water dikinase regulatory protein [Rhodovibrionaceae bacterium]|nr:pyruvate, water dikinase regulatory protein [Rhodovibrionaceae bacterium]
MTTHHLHLVSDATGETINSVARACLVQFKGVEPIEHVWSLVRTRGQMDKVLAGVREHPGPVLFTLVNEELRGLLMSGCRSIGVPCIPVLDPVIFALASYFGVGIRGQPGLQHVMDTEYFERIEAMNFTMSHDDGQMLADIEQADVVLVGVSRTSKTPTCIYLANRGIKAANVPVVPNMPLPDEVLRARHPMVVGLTKDPNRLVQLRRNRLRMKDSEMQETDYVNLESVREEVAYARRVCTKHRWHMIDVTRRSIEETAASILSLYAQHQAKAS